jgi:hypothetical protein
MKTDDEIMDLSIDLCVNTGADVDTAQQGELSAEGAETLRAYAVESGTLTADEAARLVALATDGLDQD